MNQQNLTQFFKSANRSISKKRKPDVYGDHHETTITQKQMQSTRTNAKAISKTIGQHSSPVSGVVGMQQMKLIIAGLYQTL